jgi:hypothetical protein
MGNRSTKDRISSMGSRKLPSAVRILDATLASSESCRDISP